MSIDETRLDVKVEVGLDPAVWTTCFECGEVFPKSWGVCRDCPGFPETEEPPEGLADFYASEADIADEKRLGWQR